MLGKKFLILAMVLIAMVGTASAAPALTVNIPTDGQMFRPNLDGTVYVDLNITFVDAADVDQLNSVHELGIQFATADGNVWITTDSNSAKQGTDLNMSSSNCTFATSNVWTTGADCIIRYTFPTNPQLGSGTYVLDINGSSYNVSGDINGTTTTIRVFNIDNRWINASTEALLNVVPIVLIAAVLVGVVLMGFGMIGGRTLLVIVVGAIVSIIAVVVYSGIMGALTP